MHAVLDAGTREQWIEVHWNVHEWPLPPLLGIDSVALIAPGGARLDAVADTAQSAPQFTRWVIRLDDYGVSLMPGGTYALRIVLSDGTVVGGTTTIPDAVPAQTLPQYEPFDRVSDTLRLSVPRVVGARGYLIAVRGRPSHGFDVGGNRYRQFSDTAIVLPGTLRTNDSDPVFVAGDSITLIVAAVEDNFYTYYRPFMDPFAGAPPSRLEGAVGVFGALVPLVVRRYVVH